MDLEEIAINDNKYSASDLELLTGEGDAEPKDYILLLARVLKNPMDLPRMLRQVCAMREGLSTDERDDLRMALIRVQIDSELRMQEDILRYQQRRYVAQVIEILLYKELLLAPREFLDEEE